MDKMIEAGNKWIEKKKKENQSYENFKKAVMEYFKLENKDDLWEKHTIFMDDILDFVNNMDVKFNEKIILDYIKREKNLIRKR